MGRLTTLQGKYFEINITRYLHLLQSPLIEDKGAYVKNLMHLYPDIGLDKFKFRILPRK